MEEMKITVNDVGTLNLGEAKKPRVKATKTIHCAQCRLDCAHTMTLDKNKEIVATCDTCGRSLKFPLCSADELNQHIENHKASSAGQVSVEMAEADQAVHDEAFLKAMGIQS